MKFEAVIGLEVHAQLRTASKIFCGCSTAFGAPPNSHTCPVCLGLPGALPVLNSEAVSLAVATALALGCRINPESRFARKNYFYPDLPKGYQISQYDRPLAEQGCVTVLSREDRSAPLEEKSFRILRLHMEEDAGKSVHRTGEDTLVNLNRTGVSLVEIVTEPDLRSATEAHDFLRQLRRILLYLGVCDGNMEEGSLRCDANVSLRPSGELQLGTKTEIKNLNSFRFLNRALEYEIQRQAAVLEDGGPITQETRLWDEHREVTVSMRSKEEAHDYRYFPDPDLLPLRVERERVDEIASGLPELPDARRSRLQSTLGLEVEDALYLTRTRPMADYFEALVAAGTDPSEALNWVRGHLSARLKQAQIEIDESPVSANALAELVALADDGTISGKIAKDVFDRMWESGGKAAEIVAAEGLGQINDEGEIEAIARSVLQAHPDKVEQFRSGKEGLLGFFVGQVMRETGGRANPATVQQVLRRELGAGS